MHNLVALESYVCYVLLKASPIIRTRAKSILEMVKIVSVPHNYFSLNNLRDELGGVVAVPTDTEVLRNLNRSPWASVDKSKSNGQLLTVTTKHMFV